MSRRLTALLAAPALAAALASGCADEAAAARVGDTTISNDDLLSEAKAIHDNEMLWGEAGPSAIEGEAPGSYSQEFVAQLLQQQVELALVEQLFENEDGELNNSDLTKARAELQGDEGFGAAFGDFPEDYQDRTVEQSAKVNYLSEKLTQQGFSEAMFELVDTTDVEISSRYGTWDATLFGSGSDQPAVIPPLGPVQPEGEGDDTEVQP